MATTLGTAALELEEDELLEPLETTVEFEDLVNRGIVAGFGCKYSKEDKWYCFLDNPYYLNGSLNEYLYLVNMTKVDYHDNVLLKSYGACYKGPRNGKHLVNCFWTVYFHNKNLHSGALDKFKPMRNNKYLSIGGTYDGKYSSEFVSYL